MATMSPLRQYRFLKHWRLTGGDDAFHAHVVEYAETSSSSTRRHAAEASVH
jgi:RNA-directed DNA polymerase